MQEIEEYNCDMPLIYQSFLPAIQAFPRRHPMIVSMAVDTYFPSDSALQYIGEIKPAYSFALRYTHEDAYFMENVGMWTVMRLRPGNISAETIHYLTYKMHQDIPKSEPFSLYLSPQEEGEPSLVLGANLFIEHKPTVAAMDTLFDTLCSVSPRVGAQFFHRPMSI